MKDEEDWEEENIGRRKRIRRIEEDWKKRIGREERKEEKDWERREEGGEERSEEQKSIV